MAGATYKVAGKSRSGARLAKPSSSAESWRETVHPSSSNVSSTLSLHPVQAIDVFQSAAFGDRRAQRRPPKHRRIWSMHLAA